MFKIGFTGTREGMSDSQKKSFLRILEQLKEKYDVKEFHHGDCFGSDRESHFLINDSNDLFNNISIIIHPPTYEKYRAFCHSDNILESKPYLERNKDIVRQSDCLIATPFKMIGDKGGTWHTINFARKLGISIFIIDPQGSIHEENN
jgi:hypothetical protein